PCSGAGSQPGSSASAPPISGTRPFLDLPGVAEQSVDPGAQLARRKVADAGAPKRPSRINVGVGGTASDPVEGRDGAVAVIADRHPPASFADQFANGAAVVSDVDGEEGHTSTVPLEDAADDILLFHAAFPFGEPERDHRRPLEEVADPEGPRFAHLAGGSAAAVRRTGKLR